MIKTLRPLLTTAFLGSIYSCGFGSGLPCYAQYVTLAGALQASNGLPASNYGITFTPSQIGFIAGTGVVVNTTTACATSVDGAVVGQPNPLSAPIVSTGFTGTLPPANYYVKIAFYDASGGVTLVSPEAVIQLNSTGRIIVAPPSNGLPAGVAGMKVYISTTSNSETLQGSTTGSAAFIQQISLASGAAVPSTNTTACKQVANDSIWPTGTGYTVALIDRSGNTLPGYPMQWQLMGAGSTINLSNGLPYYNGTVVFPSPILASPLNHNAQSISGPLGLSGYNLLNVGALGLGTSFPAWPIDVENGAVNASGGYIFNGGAGVATGQCLLADSDLFHTFRVPGNCLTSIGALYYQTVAANGTAQTQRPLLNFSQQFAIADSGAPASTVVDLAAVGSGGSCTNPAGLTWDSYGRLRACTNGSTPGGTDYVWTFTSCGNNVGQPSQCGGTTTLPGAMPGTPYSLHCDVFPGSEPSDQFIVVTTWPLPTNSGGSIAYRMVQPMQNGTSGGATLPVVCHAHHP